MQLAIMDKQPDNQSLIIILICHFCLQAVENQNKEEEQIASSGAKAPDNVFFLKQYVGNACGTVGLIHSIANNVNK